MIDQVGAVSTHRRRLTDRPGALRAWFALVLGVFTVLGLAAPVSATPEAVTVVSSSPADGSVLDNAPVAIIINFSGEVGATTNVALTCDAEIVQLPAPEFGDDDVSLTVDLEGVTIPRGTCSIRWTANDDDGAPVGSGIITFSVTNGSDGAGGAVDDTTSTVPPTDTTPAPSTGTESSESSNAVPLDDFSVSGPATAPSGSDDSSPPPGSPCCSAASCSSPWPGPRASSTW